VVAPPSRRTPASVVETAPSSPVPASVVPPDEEPPDEDPLDEEVPDEEAPDEEAPDEEAPDEEAPDEEVPDEEVPDEEVPDEEVPDEVRPDEEPPDAVPLDEEAPGPAPSGPALLSPPLEPPSVGSPVCDASPEPGAAPELDGADDEQAPRVRPKARVQKQRQIFMRFLSDGRRVLNRKRRPNVRHATHHHAADATGRESGSLGDKEDAPGTRGDPAVPKPRARECDQGIPWATRASYHAVAIGCAPARLG
jgi:hypothetical protein